MSRSLTNEQFKERASHIHKNKYDYSITEFIATRAPINIICNKHGTFTQLARTHLKGSGCKKCQYENLPQNNPKLISSFIEEANLIHNFKFDYSKINYINCYTNVIIFCPIHNLEFKQTPNNHLYGHKNVNGQLTGTGCPKCARENSRYSLQEFIECASIIHNNKYDYSKSIYINSDIKIEIICTIHGSFKQLPSAHLSGNGCKKCGRLITSIKQLKSLSKFIDEVNEIHHNIYDYSKSIYSGLKNKIEIICIKHGSFFQTPGAHLHGQQGCPKCFTNISHMEIEWLNSLGLPNNEKYRQVTIRVNKKRFLVDGFNPETNTIYEFNGDKWHGNPKIYNPEDIDPLIKKSYLELHQKTLNKELALKNAGFNVISIWEYDWINK